MIFAWLGCTAVPPPPVVPEPVVAAPEPVVAAPAPIEPPSPPSLVGQVPWGFVDVASLANVQIEPRYHTADNFTGAPLPGYGAAALWLDARTADALAGVAEALQRDGYGLLVYDAYRPVRATQAMVAWTERTDQAHLIRDGYIAARSGHNHGNTVDLTLTRDGVALDLGTPWDTFSTASHTANATGEALELRERLSKAMRGGGFRPYSKEWWHFAWGKGGEPRDVPYGCFEAPEGDWTAPEDWTNPAWRAPEAWTATSCSP